MRNIAPLMALSSPHTHTQFCDGVSTALEMVQSALDKGFVSLGFSSHAIQDMYQEYSLNEEREVLYINEVRRLQKAFEGQIKIWLGMERDLISPASREAYEYVVGAVHYVIAEDGTKYPVDASAAITEEVVNKVYKGDALEFADAYYANLGEYIKGYQPDVIAHFDLLTKYNHQNHLIDTRHPRYIKAACEAMDAAIQGCKLMEVNVGGMVRAGTPEPYPSLLLLKYWREIGGQVILSPDCHNASQLNAKYEEGLAHIRKAGFRTALIMGRGQELFEEVPVPRE